MIDGSSSQHHGVVVGPFGGVAPTLLVAIPEVTASWVPNDAIRKASPHGECKLHLDKTLRKLLYVGNRVKDIHNRICKLRIRGTLRLISDQSVLVKKYAIGESDQSQGRSPYVCTVIVLGRGCHTLPLAFPNYNNFLTMDTRI